MRGDCCSSIGSNGTLPDIGLKSNTQTVTLPTKLVIVGRQKPGMDFSLPCLYKPNRATYKIPPQLLGRTVRLCVKAITNY